jgi:hypothetical protein
MRRVTFAAAVFALGAGLLTAAASAGAPPTPERLSQTGLYDPRPPYGFVMGSGVISFSPQYPLWSDGAAKRRWVFLPDGATIDARHADAWTFPVGTKFWKEFTFGGRRVETRMLWKVTVDEWRFASYAWHEDQGDATLAPAAGLRRVAEIAPGAFHSIPSIDDCRACHDSGRTEILGFTALQLSTDRDPNAIHGEPLTPGMVTLATLHEQGRLQPARPELVTSPPRIAAASPRERAALGYLGVNCGVCHNAAGTLDNLRLDLKRPSLTALSSAATKWDRPHSAPGTTRALVPGDAAHSAIVLRMRSRRPSTQMPPLGTVIVDREAMSAVEDWINGLRDRPSRGPVAP